jgi:acetyl esterase/lipase
MPSVQSYVFRAAGKMLSTRMFSMDSIPKLRRFTERVSAPMRLPNGVTTERVKLDDVSVEWLTPQNLLSNSIILYAHGGAWILGWYQNHRVLAAHIARACHCRVLGVDYRMAPDFPFPAAIHDYLAVYRRLLRDGMHPHEIFFAGDSAGANILLAALFTLRDAGEPLPAAAVCLSPVTDLTFSGKSHQKNRDALLTTDFLQSAARHYIGSHDPSTPLISPHFGNMTGLPPLLVHCGGDEILLSDAERLADHAKQAGVDVSLNMWPHMWHVWHIFAPYLPEATQAIEDIGRFVRRHIPNPDKPEPRKKKGHRS